MTRKDFNLIAAALNEARIFSTINPALVTAQQGVDIAISFLAESLAEANPRFDAERFIAACN